MCKIIFGEKKVIVDNTNISSLEPKVQQIMRTQYCHQFAFHYINVKRLNQFSAFNGYHEIKKGL